MHRVISGTSSGGKNASYEAGNMVYYDASFLSNLTTSVMPNVQLNGT
jgi:hypothetical protein